MTAYLHQDLQYLRTLPIHCFVLLGMAALCGSMVGLERELKRKAAGIRTNAMICMGATLYMLFSEIVMTQHTGMAGDYTRIGGQVVVGMGFIGAGAIIQSQGQVVGLTTAATLWVVAAIGLIIGSGYPLVGLIITFFVIVLLVGVGKLESLIYKKERNSHTPSS